MNILGHGTDSGIYDMPESGKAIIWAAVPLQWNIPVSEWTDDMLATVYGSVDGTEVVRETIPIELAKQLDTVIGFKFRDALGCEFGFGVAFAKRK